MMLRITMIIEMLTLPTIRAEGVAVPRRVLGTKLGNCILAETPREHLRNLVASLIALTLVLFEDGTKVRIVGVAWHAVQAEVLIARTASVMTMADIYLALQARKSIWTGAVHTIFILLRMNWKVEFIIRVFISLDSKATGSSIGAI